MIFIISMYISILLLTQTRFAFDIKESKGVQANIQGECPGVETTRITYVKKA